MKKLVPFVLCSTVAVLSLGAVSARAGFVSPRVPESTAEVASRSAGDLRYGPEGVATVRMVTTVNDDGPGSLRQAIASAGPGDTIDFALTVPATIVLSNTLVISQDLSVVGPGPDQLTVMRSDATNTPWFRVFDIEAGVVVLAGMTIRNGIGYDASHFVDNVGGGIFNRGLLTVSNCVITANTAPNTSLNGTNSLGFGGGIFTDKRSQLTVINSTFSANQAGAAGGGICTFEAAQFFVTGCTVNGNFAGMQGGGVNYQGRTGTMQNCTIAGNTSPEDAAGSAVANVVFEAEPPTLLTLTACTVAGNTGNTNGAIAVAGLNSGLGLTNRMLSCLVAANTEPNFAFYGTVSFQSLGNNLDSDGTSGLVNGANGDLVGTVASPIDAKLGPLQNNGGPTLTMALLPDSPALDSGACADANGSPLLIDQRGLPRPQGPGCDIGAYEFQPLSLTCPPGVVVEFLNETGAVAVFSAAATSSCPNVTIVYTPPPGSVFPIGVTPVLVQATDGCSNSAQCSFNVTVLGAQGVKSNVLAELIALLASTPFPQPLAQKLDDAIQHLAASLNPAYWIDQTHLQPRGGNTAMNEEKLAVNKLQDIADAKDSPVAPAVLQGFIDRIVKSDRLLAIISIQDAADAGLNPKKIAEDQAMVAKGDAEVVAGRYVNAIEHYRNAWRHALQLRLKVGLNPDGSTRVQFVGNYSKSYLIEVSADMANWVSLGTCAADAEGDVEFTDQHAAAGLLRFYRAVER
jgi:hypothetical protein